jgi:outer membrane usher protein
MPQKRRSAQRATKDISQDCEFHLPRLRLMHCVLAAVVWGGMQANAFAQAAPADPAAGGAGEQTQTNDGDAAARPASGSGGTDARATVAAKDAGGPDDAHGKADPQEPGDPDGKTDVAGDDGVITFNTGFLRAGTAADVSALVRGNGVVPGTHKVDVMLNGSSAGSHDIAFRRIGDKWNVQPCLTAELLDALNVDFRAVMGKASKQPSAGKGQPASGVTADGKTAPGTPGSDACIDLSALMQGARVDYDPGMLTLNLSVPQAYVRRSPRGYVDPSRWDAGINAAYTNYYFSANHSAHEGYPSNESFYLGLSNGVNLGGWRLRNDASISQDSGFQSSRTYVQHDITRWNGTFTAGESYTPSDMFDSIRFRGVQIATDEAMLPDSMREYAPIVRGVADTNATIEIRQNGYMMYQTVVPPGPFEINDLYPNGSSGDLEITIIEADGRRRVFRQPYASVPIMLRKGGLKYSFTTGQYNSGFSGEHPVFAQGTVIKGVTDSTTLYGGALMSENYQSVVGGVGVNTPIGAISLDLAHAHARAPTGQDEKGQSLRFLYQRTFTQTDTNFTLAGYRYSTRGYRTFAESLEDTAWTDLDYGGYGSLRQKGRMNLTVNQSLGDKGSLYLTAGRTRFWNTAGDDVLLQAGYSGTFKRVSYNVSLSRTRSPYDERNDTRVGVNLTIPLGKDAYAPRATVNVNGGEYASVQTGVSGTFGDQHDWSYSAQAAAQGAGPSGSASLSHDSEKANVSVSASHGRGYTQAGINVSGAAVLHAGGLTFGPQVGDGFGLVHVPDVEGVGVGGGNGAQTDANGYAIVPYNQPYRINEVSIDLRNLETDAEIDATVAQTVPRRGAITLSEFAAKTGRRAVFRLTDAEGKSLPFGAQVLDDKGAVLGTVGQSGKALVTGVADRGTVAVQVDGKTVCEKPYALPEAATRKYEIVNIQCAPVR